MKNARPPVFRPPWLPSREHRLALFREEQARNNPRPPREARGYDADWRELRRRHLAEHPWCVECKKLGRETPARIVDHVVPVSVAPDRRLDPTNLASMCMPHHTAKSMRERAARRRTGLRVG